MFLCSLFAPVCLDRLIYPCRSLCEAVQQGCEQRMLTYGFPWPKMLECSQFPHDNDMCIPPQTQGRLQAASSDSSASTADSGEFWGWGDVRAGWSVIEVSPVLRNLQGVQPGQYVREHPGQLLSGRLRYAFFFMFQLFRVER